MNKYFNITSGSNIVADTSANGFYFNVTSTTAPTGVILTTGATITTSGPYTIYTFTGSGLFEVSGGSINADYILLGGGGGGAANGGGGGAGQFVESTGLTNSISSGIYVVAVGAGGIGSVRNTPFNVAPATPGTKSTFGNLFAAYKGGANFGGNITNGSPSYFSDLDAYNNGGNGITLGSGFFLGGGGGATTNGGAPATSSPSRGGKGGDGFFSNILSVQIGGAGGGGTHVGSASISTTQSGNGGAGGGGKGGYQLTTTSWVNGVSGLPNTGGGGGGRTNSSNTVGTAGGNGGSGIVAIRVLTNP